MTDSPYLLPPSNTLIAPNGQEIKQHGSPEFPFAYYHGPEANHIPWHWHDEFECTIIHKGSAYCSTPQGQFLLKEGDGIFLNSGTLHAWDIPPVEHTSEDTLVFHGKLVYGAESSVFYQKYILQFTSQTASPVFLLSQNIPWQTTVLEHIKKAIQLCQKSSDGYEFAVRSLLSEIIFDIYKHYRIPDKEISVNYFENQRVKQMLLYLQENYSHAVTLTQLANHVNICERECLRCFKKILRLSPIQYLIRYRISRACIFLQDDTLSVLEIASLCGFESPSYFAKTFRQHINCTPTEYRRRFQHT